MILYATDPDSFRDALENYNEDRTVVLTFSGDVHLETDISIIGNVKITGKHLTSPFCLRNRGLLWNRSQSVELENIAIYPGSKTVLKKIKGSLNQTVLPNVYHYQLPDLVAKNLPRHGDLEACYYDPVALGNNIELRTQRTPLPKAGSFDELLNSFVDGWFFDVAGKCVYLKLSNYAEHGECVITTEKPVLPDAITIRDKGDPGIGNNRFTNCSFGAGCDITVSAFGVFDRCLFGYGVSLDYHPKLVGHSKLWITMIADTFSDVSHCLFSDYHDRPRVSDGANANIRNNWFNKSTQASVEIDSRNSSQGSIVDVVNNIFTSQEKYAAKFLLNSPLNSVFTRNWEIDGTLHFDPWQIQHIHQAPFAARDTLGTTSAMPPSAFEIAESPHYGEVEHVDFSELKQNILANVGCCPNNRHPICSSIIRSVLNPTEPVQIFTEFE